MGNQTNKAGRPKGIPKSGGRQKGTPNRVTKDVREWLSKLINKSRRQIERDLQELEPKDRVIMLERLMQYVVPKQQAIKADIANLTDDELSDIANRILSEIKEGTDYDY